MPVLPPLPMDGAEGEEQVYVRDLYEEDEDEYDTYELDDDVYESEASNDVEAGALDDHTLDKRVHGDEEKEGADKARGDR